MLTGKENLRETMKKDGNPDRFVKQYEFLHLLVPDTYYMGNYPIIPGSPDGVDQFGVTWTLPPGQMGAFPKHDDERCSSTTVVILEHYLLKEKKRKEKKRIEKK